MTIERAIEILDPTHREHYDSLATVEEACRMGMAALKRMKAIETFDLETIVPGERYLCVTEYGTSIDVQVVKFDYRRGEAIMFEKGFRARPEYGKKWFLVPIREIIEIFLKQKQ